MLVREFNEIHVLVAAKYLQPFFIKKHVSVVVQLHHTIQWQGKENFTCKTEGIRILMAV